MCKLQGSGVLCIRIPAHSLQAEPPQGSLHFLTCVGRSHVKLKPPGYGPQAFVNVSIYQISTLGAYF